MTTLEFSHNSGLVVVSFLIALVAGFTGLTLTKDLSQKSFSQRKIAVSLASVALGGGIWSMHFVAMLGLQMPVLFYYDAAITLASALLAILIVGVALGLLHFFERRPKILFLSGSLVGFGILTMHYLGMAGLQLCRPIYTVQRSGSPMSSAQTVIYYWERFVSVWRFLRFISWPSGAPALSKLRRLMSWGLALQTKFWRWS